MQDDGIPVAAMLMEGYSRKRKLSKSKGCKWLYSMLLHKYSYLFC